MCEKSVKCIFSFVKSIVDIALRLLKVLNICINIKVIVYLQVKTAGQKYIKSSFFSRISIQTLWKAGNAGNSTRKQWEENGKPHSMRKTTVKNSKAANYSTGHTSTKVWIVMIQVMMQMNSIKCLMRLTICYHQFVFIGPRANCKSPLLRIYL